MAARAEGSSLTKNLNPGGGAGGEIFDQKGGAGGGRGGSMAAGGVKTVNPGAELMGAQAALFMNINAAKGLLDVMRSNLGPKGTLKQLVSGAGGAARGPRPPVPPPLPARPARRGSPPRPPRALSSPAPAGPGGSATLPPCLPRPAPRRPGAGGVVRRRAWQGHRGSARCSLTGGG